MKIVRNPDWQLKLSEYIANQMHREFEYGVSDCALFAAGAVEAMTGVDLAAPYRGRYARRGQGVRLLRADGHDDHVAALGGILRAGPVATARPGDLIEVAGDDGPALGVAQGPSIYVMLPNSGIGLINLLDGLQAYFVPYPGEFE